MGPHGTWFDFIPGLKGVEARPTGVFLLYAHMLDIYIPNTIKTGVLATVAIWLMLTALFRSPVMAILVIIPEVLPVIFVLGVMGFAGIPLDMVTVIIASHDPHLVEQFGQREIVLDSGRISVDKLHANAASRMTAQAPRLADLPNIDLRK